MKRIRYFDLLRVICFSIVVFYHMMIQLYFNGMFAMDAIEPFFVTANINTGVVAVTLFFMLSGASLVISTKDSVDWKQFYIKRFIRLLFPFYFVNICWFIVRAIRAKSIFALIEGIAPWKILLGVLGIDEWLTLYGVSGFSQGIGEWFLGCLIILYVLFPIFRKLMLKNKILFSAIVISVYVAVIYSYSSSIPVYQNILVKGCEFIFGMYLGAYQGSLNKKAVVVSLPVVVFYLTGKTPLGINSAVNITVCALAFFITVSFTENILQKSTYFYKWIAFLSGCSYELFLIHHLVIYTLTPIAKQYMHIKTHVLELFIIELAVMGILTLVVKNICDYFIKRIKGRALPSAGNIEGI